MTHDAQVPKEQVILWLNEDLVRRAIEFSGDLSELVERLLADFIAARQAGPQA